MKIDSLILRKLAIKSNAAVAAAIGKNESQISRFVAGHQGLMFDDFEAFFNALGLVIVDGDTDFVMVGRDEYEALRTLAREALSRPLGIKTMLRD